MGCTRLVVGSWEQRGDEVTLSLRLLDSARGSLSAPFAGSAPLAGLAGLVRSLAWDVALAGPHPPVGTRDALLRGIADPPVEALRVIGEGLLAREATTRIAALRHALALAPESEETVLALGRLLVRHQRVRGGEEPARARATRFRLRAGRALPGGRRPARAAPRARGGCVVRRPRAGAPQRCRPVQPRGGEAAPCQRRQRRLGAAPPGARSRAGRARAAVRPRLRLAGRGRRTRRRLLAEGSAAAGSFRRAGTASPLVGAANGRTCQRGRGAVAGRVRPRLDARRNAGTRPEPQVGARRAVGAGAARGPGAANRHRGGCRADGSCRDACCRATRRARSPR